jgi:hypothetical protein
MPRWAPLKGAGRDKDLARHLMSVFHQMLVLGRVMASVLAYSRHQEEERRDDQNDREK